MAEKFQEASLSLIGPRMLKSLSCIACPLILPAPSSTGLPTLTLVLEGRFHNSVEFLKRTGGVCAGVEGPSWLWILPEMNIFSSGT